MSVRGSLRHPLRHNEFMAVFRFSVVLICLIVYSSADAKAATEYRFEFAAGWGGPHYSVAVRHDGHAAIEFCGEDGTTFFVGCRKDLLSNSQWERFQEVLARIEFDRLGPLYEALRTDQPIFTLCQKRPPKCVNVRDRLALPENARQMDKWIADALGVGDWVHGSTKAVRDLKAENFDFNQRDRRSGSTILIRAVKVSTPDVVSELLKNGANVNRKGRTGDTPLQWATDLPYLRSETVRFLINAGAHVCQQNASDVTVLEDLRREKANFLSIGVPIPPEMVTVEKLLTDAGGECVPNSR
jgi:Ankyrin repeats (3 copies)